MKTTTLFILTIASASALFSKDLKNSDIVDMVNAGLPEKTIVLAIESSTSKFDTTAMALIDLKKRGVSDAIIDATLRASSPKNEHSAKPQEDFISDGRIVLWDKDTIIDLTAIGILARPSLSNAFGLSESNVLYFPEPKSPKRISNKLPEFEQCLPPNLPGDGTLILMRLEEKDNRRVLVMNGPNRFSKKSVISMTSKVLQNTNRVPPERKLWRYTLKTPLQPGEYVFWCDNRFYDFGVDAQAATLPENTK